MNEAHDLKPSHGNKGLSCKKWTPEKVLAELHKHAQSGAPLNSAALLRKRCDLLAAMRRHFGSWEKAMRVAGYEPKQHKVHKNTWTKESVAEAVRAWSAQHGVVQMRRIKATDKALAAAVSMYWGSLSKLNETLGLPVYEQVKSEAWTKAGKPRFEKRPPGYWTPKRVMEEVRALHAQEQLLFSKTVKRERAGLYDAAVRHFYSWRLLMERLEIPKEAYVKTRKWNPERVCAALREWSSAHGVLDRLSLKRDNSALCATAEKYFKTLEQAATAAGVPFRHRQTPWTTEKVLEAIKARAKRKMSLKPIIVKQTQYGMYRAAVRRYGSWKKALAAVGLEAVEGMRKVWAKGELEAELRAWVQRYGILKSGSLMKTNRKLFDGIRNRYGSCQAAARALGLPYGERLRWTAEKVREVVFERIRQGRSISPDPLRREAGGLYKALRRIFGSWEESLRSMGLDPQLYLAEQTETQRKSVQERSSAATG
jgi:hypothetical protein